MASFLRGIDHDVLRIGRYDKKLGKLVNIRKSELFRIVNCHVEFRGLPGSSSSDHGLGFEIRTSKYKGVEFPFRPKRLGIYLITASWRLEEPKGEISSSPIVLVVKPPLDAEGHPIVKPEWLEEN
jgi:hypothetical protein